ncbi:MAG: thiamine pyrophosphate-binding protein [Betaproteobacteria bacterium]|nr:thiamine pyrophosphate-binding protein [Betaproteobacteria bacterium]
MKQQESDGAWGSDAIAATLRALDVPYVLLNPGSSFRGLHDSLVNYLGNELPKMLVVLHEEHAVAIAHGYAKVAGRPLAAIVHANVGLMHASMAIFNAWVDRVPVLVLGATGPVDAAKRRPWIDWIHTAQDQGALVRPFIKWDAQPASVQAACEALLRAAQIAETAPKGPVYVCFDAGLQEARLDRLPPLPEPARYRPPLPARPADERVRAAAQWLAGAQRPLILIGRVARSRDAWDERVALAEALGASVLTDLKTGASFPTGHPLNAAPPGTFLHPAAAAAIRSSDVVLSLDWIDLAGTFKQAFGEERVGCRVIHASLDQQLHNGWSMDHFAAPPVDLFLPCDPDLLTSLLRLALPPHIGKATTVTRPAAAPPAVTVATSGSTLAQVAEALRVALGVQDVCLIRLPLGWSGELWHFRAPLDYLGQDGGAGIGSGPGMAVGAALALRGSGRLPVALLGDGDFLMGATAFWTAANARVPLLAVICNNRSFFNDVLHQERIARARGRPVENRWIGQRIADPEPDLAMMARSQGLVGIGPVRQAEELAQALAQAISAVREGAAVVVDVHVAEVSPA